MAKAVADYVLNATVDDIANFKQTNRKFVGHLVSLTVGGEELKADFNFLDPTSPASKLPICGMITFVQWDKKPGGILLLEGRVSAANQGVLADAISAKDKTAECEFNLNIYQYDYSTHTYFKCFHTDGKAIKGKLSEETPSDVSPEVAEEYKQTPNHRYTLAIVGSDQADEQLLIAFDPNRKATLAFGQKCTAG